MLQLLAAFFFSLIIIGALLWVLSRGRAPAYRPTRQEVLTLLEGVSDKTTSTQAWDMFVSLPIHHDPELEGIRRRCVELQEGSGDEPPLRAGIGGYVFDRESRGRLADVIDELRALIASEPAHREF